MRRMSPRPSPAGTPLEGRNLVWAVDRQRLPHYLLPRDCPRVCWSAAPTTTEADRQRYLPTAGRVIAVESAWLPGLRDAGLLVHRCEPQPFRDLSAEDPAFADSGYWASDLDVRVLDVQVVEDCLAELGRAGIELRIVPDLNPYLDAVTSSTLAFSAIRMRNAGAGFAGPRG